MYDSVITLLNDMRAHALDPGYSIVSADDQKHGIIRFEARNAQNQKVTGWSISRSALRLSLQKIFATDPTDDCLQLMQSRSGRASIAMAISLKSPLGKDALEKHSAAMARPTPALEDMLTPDQIRLLEQITT